MIDHRRKLILVHIARTGGTSIEAALVGDDWWRIDPDTKHLSASQSRRHYGDDVWSAYTTFSVVRNPWDRIVSMWATGWWFSDVTEFEGVAPATLHDFVARVRPHPNEKYESLHYHEILDEPVDHVLRFERLQEEFSALLEGVGADDLVLPRAEPSERGHHREYYDERTMALVGETFARDISTYGYRF
jgi:hypothetical protein